LLEPQSNDVSMRQPGGIWNGGITARSFTLNQMSSNMPPEVMSHEPCSHATSSASLRALARMLFR